MENKNNAQVSANSITDLPPITPRTKLGEVIAMLNLGEKPSKIPTPRSLYDTAGEPVADMRDCTLFRNGFVIYQNRSGRTVVWLPDCTRFTYNFNKLRDAEKNTLRETYTLPEEYLEKQPWVIAVTLIGDHRVESNVMNRSGSRVGTTDFDSSDLDDCDDEETEAVANLHQKKFRWMDEMIGEDPLTIVIRRESKREMLAVMTEKQRQAFLLYFRYGYTEKQIATILGISRDSVNDRLSGALKKIKKISASAHKTPSPVTDSEGARK